MKPCALVESIETRRLMADFSASVNFQPLASARPAGMIVDYGVTSAVRRGGLTYGWSQDLTANAVDRNVTSVQKNDTFISVPKGAHWDLVVPNGTYKVYVVAGDPARSGDRMALTVEGGVAVAGITRPAKPFLEALVTVDVTDGTLTLTSAGVWGQDKVNYIAVVSVGDSSSNTPSVVTTNKISWKTGPKQLVPRTEPESAVVGDKLYVFSGYGDKSTGGDGWQPSASYERYDPATNKWTKLGNMPIGTTHSAVTVVGTDVWFVGGYTARPGTNDKQDVTTTNVWVYHTKTNTWNTGPALPQRRASGGLGLINNKLYYTSGEPQDHHSNSVDTWALDLTKQSAGWTTKAPIPDGRTHFGTAVVNNKLYVIGGQKDIDANATFLKSSYVYDPATNKWSRIADLPSVRSHLSPNTFVLNSKIYFFGGEWKFNYELNESMVYDPVLNKYTKLTSLPSLRAAGAAGFVGGKIVFTGGKNNGFFSDTYIGTFV